MNNIKIFEKFISDNVIFLRNVRYDNSTTKRKLPYMGIQCWAINENDIEYFYNQSYYTGRGSTGDRKNYVEVNPIGFDIYALDFKQAHEYVMGLRPEPPVPELFDAIIHTLRFVACDPTHKNIYSHHSELTYQIVMIPTGTTF